MSNETKEMLKQFVYLTLDDDHGISKEAYQMIMQILVHDRDMASILHDVVEMASENSDSRFMINP
jgi:hypothetical protein